VHIRRDDWPQGALPRAGLPPPAAPHHRCARHALEPTLPTMALLTIALPTMATPTRCSARPQRRTSRPSPTHRPCSSYARCPSSPRGACAYMWSEIFPQGYACCGYTYYGYTYYGRPWSEIFPSASEQCLDLLARMLVFNPAKRCSMQESYSLYLLTLTVCLLCLPYSLCLLCWLYLPCQALLDAGCADV